MVNKYQTKPLAPLVHQRTSTESPVEQLLRTAERLNEHQSTVIVFKQFVALCYAGTDAPFEFSSSVFRSNLMAQRLLDKSGKPLPELAAAICARYNRDGSVMPDEPELVEQLSGMVAVLAEA